MNFKEFGGYDIVKRNFSSWSVKIRKTFIEKNSKKIEEVFIYSFLEKKIYINYNKSNC